MSIDRLRATDPEIADAVARETARQRTGLELIASENIVSEAVLEALGTPLTNKYAEGYPGRRWYGGTGIVDEVERTAIARATALFGAEHANVQPHAGATANLAAYAALMKPGDTMLALRLADGGHLTHGSQASVTGMFWRTAAYGVHRETERIDMNEVREAALRERPRVIVAGASAYARHIDFAAFRAIADEVGAYLMVDMAHIAGLVAAKLHPDPVLHADIITTTTHKTLRGPRGGMILCRTEDRLRPDAGRTLAARVDAAVFPGTQGGPLEHVIAAKAVALHEAAQPDFTDYQRHTLANAVALAEALAEGGLRLVSGGTDNHLVLTDLTPLGIGGALAERTLERVGISANKNLIPFDTRKPTDPSGLRLGTPSLTTRGMNEATMHDIGTLVVAALRGHDDAATLNRVSARVREIAEAHPVYPGLPY